MKCDTPAVVKTIIDNLPHENKNVKYEVAITEIIAWKDAFGSHILHHSY